MAKPSKTKKSETLVAFVLDKSGSMGTVQGATISGFNEYIDSLSKQKDVSYTFSLTLFNTLVEKRIVAEPLKSVSHLTRDNYTPNGMTALYDAVMQTIEGVEQNLKANQKVLCVIMTDGEENSSKEYTEKELKTKVTELEKTGKWTFVFLGANQDAWAAGQKFGMQAGNTVMYMASSAGTSAAINTVSMNTRSFAASADAQTQNFFSKKDQDDLKGTQ